MRTNVLPRLGLAWLLFLLAFALMPVRAEGPSKPTKITAVLQPFVDNHSLAGAVTLVADKDKVLSLEAVGFADIAAKKPMRRRRAVLDRLAVQADHRRGVDDAGGRGQGERSTTRSRNICRSSKDQW